MRMQRPRTARGWSVLGAVSLTVTLTLTLTVTLSRDEQLAPPQFMFSQLLSTVDVPHSPSASHITPSGTPVQLAMTSRASLVGHSARSTLFKQTPQLSYPASQREHGKAADEESASNSSAAVGGMPGWRARPLSWQLHRYQSVRSRCVQKLGWTKLHPDTRKMRSRRFIVAQTCAEDCVPCRICGCSPR